MNLGTLSVQSTVASASSRRSSSARCTAAGCGVPVTHLKRRRPGRKAPEPDLKLALAPLTSAIAFERALLDLHQIAKIHHHGKWSIQIQRTVNPGVGARDPRTRACVGSECSSGRRPSGRRQLAHPRRSEG